MADTSFPNVNGITCDFASVRANIDGENYFLGSINYSHECTPGEVEGNDAMLLGTTTGRYKANGSVEVYKATAAAIRAKLGDGYLTKRFPITVNYQPPGSPIMTDVLEYARIVKEDDSHSKGTDALVEKWDLHIMKIVKNGVQPLPNPLY